MIGEFKPENEQIVAVSLNPCLRLGDTTRRVRLPEGAVGIALEDSHDRYTWDPERREVIDHARMDPSICVIESAD